MTKLPLAIDGAADHARILFLAHRHRFAGHHGFVERGVALEHDAVDRHLVAGLDAQLVADRDRLERNLLVAAVILDAARGLGREIEQRLDRAGGGLARAQFEHLADQHQHGDHAGGFEIDRRRSAVAAEGVRENAGRESGDQAVAVSHADAHADQREHVEIARDQRLRAAHEERPAGPQHHRRGEGELDVIRQRRLDPIVRPDEVPAHFQHHHGQRQDEADPEPARHVGELGIGAAVGGGDLGLQSHAADRAGAGADLPDLGMHRAGVDGAFDHRLGFALAQIFLRVGDELGAAAGGAEIIGVAAVIGAMLGGLRIDRHAADRIDLASSLWFGRAMARYFCGSARNLVRQPLQQK